MEAVPDVGSTTGSTKIDIPKYQKVMPGVGFEPTRTKRPADLKSAPLDPSGIQAKKILLGKPEEREKKIKIVKKIKNYPWRDLNPQSSDS